MYKKSNEEKKVKPELKIRNDDKKNICKFVKVMIMIHL